MLSDAKIRVLKPADKIYKLFDGQGLHLEVRPSGARYWRFKYCFQGKEKLLSLGVYPAVSLKEARSERDRLRDLVAAGEDPGLLRKQDKHRKRLASDNTFEKIARAWWERWRGNKAERTQREVLSRLESKNFPLIGTFPVTELTSLDFIQAFQSIEGQGLTDVARRCVQVCSQIMRFAVGNGFTERNALADVKPGDFLKPYKQQNFARVSIQELPELVKKIGEYKGNFATCMALKMMLYTFVRTSELIEAEWQEFDFSSSTWRIPAARMKMGGFDHLVPLSRQALEIVKALRAVYGHKQYVFPGEGRAKTISNNTILYALYRMGYHSRMTGHGFRGVASTQLHEMGFPAEHIELQLAHIQRNKSAAPYNYAKYLAQRREMMQAWADFVDSVRGMESNGEGGSI